METTVTQRQMSADEKIRWEAYYREKRLHDEASALGSARREGRAEGRAEGRKEERSKLTQKLRKKGLSEAEIQELLEE